MASWHVSQSGQSLLGLWLPEPGHFNIWHIPAWLPAHCSLVWSERHNDIGGPDIPSSGSAGQALFVLREASGRAQLWDQVPASFGDEEAVVVHGRRGAEQLRIAEKAIGGSPSSWPPSSTAPWLRGRASQPAAPCLLAPGQGFPACRYLPPGSGAGLPTLPLPASWLRGRASQPAAPSLLAPGQGFPACRSLPPGSGAGLPSLPLPVSWLRGRASQPAATCLLAPGQGFPACRYLPPGPGAGLPSLPQPGSGAGLPSLPLTASGILLPAYHPPSHRFQLPFPSDPPSQPPLPVSSIRLQAAVSSIHSPLTLPHSHPLPASNIRLHATAAGSQTL
jgi:hypothetical protein